MEKEWEQTWVPLTSGRVYCLDDVDHRSPAAVGSASADPGQLKRCGTVTHWIWRLTFLVSTARERLRPPSNALPNIAKHAAE